MVHRGFRWSIARRFLRRAMKRDNVTVNMRCHTSRTLFGGDRAVGVEFQKKSTTYLAYVIKK